MSITIGGILCEEIVADFGEAFDLIEGPSANKAFLCNWSDRYAVAHGVLGLNSTASIGGFITIKVPMRYPEISYMYAYQIAIKGVGPPFGAAPQFQYPYAVIMVNYKCTPWSFSGIDDQFNQLDPSTLFIYAEQSIKSSAEWQQIPNKSSKFEATNNVNPNSYYFKHSIVDMVITFHQVPYLPSNQALTYPGFLNDRLFLGVQTGCMRFDGMDSKRTHSTDGKSTSDVTLSFQARFIRWDYDWDPTAQAFDRVLKPDGSAFQQLVDLSVVLPPAFRY